MHPAPQVISADRAAAAAQELAAEAAAAADKAATDAAAAAQAAAAQQQELQEGLDKAVMERTHAEHLLAAAQRQVGAGWGGWGRYSRLHELLHAWEGRQLRACCACQCSGSPSGSRAVLSRGVLSHILS